MINQTPSDLDKFPVPVAGQKIPRGWFGRLVRFINSLILHGDGQYLTVKHTQAGQTITPTPALLQALGQRGAPPAAGGAAQDISASVSGGTATISLSGSTSSAQLVAGSNVNITGNTNGQIEIGASANTGMPDYSATPTFVTVDSAHPFINTFQYSIWMIGHAAADTSTDMSGTASLVFDTTRSVSLFHLSAYPNQAAFYGIAHGFCIPVPAGSRIGITASGNVGVTMYIYPAIA